jgi:hypothetical protein
MNVVVGRRGAAVPELEADPDVSDAPPGGGGDDGSGGGDDGSGATAPGW